MWLPFNGKRQKNINSKSVTPDAKDSASVGRMLSFMNTNPAIFEKQRWTKRCEEYWSSRRFESSNALEYKTLMTQEMLKRGFLASSLFYASTAHTDKILNSYFSNLDDVFSLISDCENGRSVAELLETPVCHAGFKRLN